MPISCNTTAVLWSNQPVFRGSVTQIIAFRATLLFHTALSHYPLKEVLPVEDAVGSGFGKMLGKDVRHVCKVGDGAGQLDDA